MNYPVMDLFLVYIALMAIFSQAFYNPGRDHDHTSAVYQAIFWLLIPVISLVMALGFMVLRLPFKELTRVLRVALFPGTRWRY